MDIKVTEESKWQRTIEIDVPQDELQPEFDRALRRYQKQVRLEGFRKGKVPLPIVKRIYGPKIEVDTIEDLLPELIARAVRQENLEIVSPPRLEDMNYEPGGTLNAKFSVEIEPEIEIKQLEGFELTKSVYVLTDDDVREHLEGLQRKHAVWEVSDKPAEKGDFLTIDLQEEDASGIAVVGHKYENETVPISEENGELTEIGRQLLGASAGESRMIHLMPDSAAAEGEPIQPIRFRATVKEVKRRILPPIDNELAKDAGFENLEGLENEIRRYIAAKMQQEFDEDLKNRLIDTLLKNNPFEVPPGLIDQLLDRLVEKLKASPENGQIDEAATREKYRPLAIWNIKWQMLSKKIVENEGLGIADDEVREHVMKIAERRRQDGGQLWRRLQANSKELDKIRDDLLQQKLVTTLLSRQKIIEQKVTLADLRKRQILEI